MSWMRLMKFDILICSYKFRNIKICLNIKNLYNFMFTVSNPTQHFLNHENRTFKTHKIPIYIKLLLSIMIHNIITRFKAKSKKAFKNYSSCLNLILTSTYILIKLRHSMLTSKKNLTKKKLLT